MPRKTFVVLMTTFCLLLIVASCNQTPLASTSEINDLESQDTFPNPTLTSKFPPGYPTIDPEEVKCLNKGGVWGRVGFRMRICNLPTTDAGQACKDNQECEGLCFADDSIRKGNKMHVILDPDAIEELNAREEEFVGYCSEREFYSGYLVVVESGKIKAVIVD